MFAITLNFNRRGFNFLNIDCFRDLSIVPGKIGVLYKAAFTTIAIITSCLFLGRITKRDAAGFLVNVQT